MGGRDGPGACNPSEPGSDSLPATPHTGGLTSYQRDPGSCVQISLLFIKKVERGFACLPQGLFQWGKSRLLSAFVHLKMLPHLIFTAPLAGRFYYASFTDETLEMLKSGKTLCILELRNNDNCMSNHTQS